MHSIDECKTILDAFIAEQFSNDERHIRRSDVYRLKEAISVELNIEGYPSEDFLRMVGEVPAMRRNIRLKCVSELNPAS